MACAGFILGRLQAGLESGLLFPHTAPRADRGRAHQVVGQASPGLFTQRRGIGILRSSSLRSSRKFALEVELLLDHRFGWLRGAYGVRMSVHDLPSAIFGPEDARDAQSHRGNILTPANLGPVALHLHDAGKIGGNELRHVLEAYYLAIPVVGCGSASPRRAS